MKITNRTIYLLITMGTIALAGTFFYFRSIFPFFVATVIFIALVIAFIQPRVLLIYLIFINERFFYLTNYSGKTTIDIMLLIILLMYIFYGKEILKHKYRFMFEITTLLLLLIASIGVSYILNGQPIGLAYHATKFMFIYTLYFPLIIFIKRYGVKYILNVVHITGSILAGSFLLQKLIYPKIIIFHVMYMERLEGVRFFTGMSIVIFASFISLSNFLTEKAKKVKYFYLVAFILQVSHLLFVAQTRGLTVILIILYTIIILSYSNQRIIEKIVSTLLIFLIGFIVFGPFIKDIIRLIFEELDYYRRGGGTLYVRKLEFQFIISQLKESWLLGLGFYSGHFVNTPRIVGTAYNYYLSDIGVFGYVFYMGILGLLVTIKYIVKLFKTSILLLKSQKKIGLISLLFTLYITLMSPVNYIFNIEIQVIYLIIFTCIIEVGLCQKDPKGK